MDNKNLFSIGEMAKAVGITRKTILNYETKGLPLTDEQKCDIVMEFDSLLRESCLFELIRTLTFNEKLVFFLFYLEDYKNMEVAALLNNSERTILNRRKSIDNKIKKMKGEL